MNISKTAPVINDLSAIDATPCYALQEKLENICQSFTRILDLSKVLSESTIDKVFDNVDVSAIKELSLATNNICHLSSKFMQRISNLIHLDLSENYLNDLPHSTSLLKNLQYLNIGENKFTNLPPVIDKLISLKTLKASKNAITDLPCCLTNLTNLEDLDLSHNQLSNLPMDYGKLEQVKHLSLAGNSFVEIPKCILYGMRSLETLDLSENPGCDIHAQPHTSKLKRFHANHNLNCLVFPKWILSFKCSLLREVSLNNTKFKAFDIPTTPFESHIRILSMQQSNLYDTHLEKLLNGMAYLEQLLVGNVSRESPGNAFCSLPVCRLQHPAKLKIVRMQATGIPIVPASIDKYTGLLSLDLSNNDITWLPDEISELNTLESLILSSNSLYLLPAAIGQIQSLKELNVNRNHLSQLPESLKELDNLRFLDLYDNDFCSIPTVMNELKNLEGTDFEQNCFSTVSLVIGETSYEILRKCVRNHWYDDRKTIGFKIIESVINDAEPNDDSRESLSNDSYSCTASDGGVIDKSFVEENWDDCEYDTDNDFDPNEIKYINPPQKSLPVCIAQMHMYCIGNIRQRLLRKSSRTDLIIVPDLVEGRFDDAD